ncbi:MAG: SAM-dependent methyltransferase [Syntrophorhabdales bacterium]
MARRILFVLFTVLALSCASGVASLQALTIGGAVRQPLNLGPEDLSRMESVSVRLNEVTRDRQFHGAFTYRGVPLRTLLDLATVEKETSVYSKAVDLAVVVRNRQGRTTVISWGELFYKNPSEVVVAISGTPLRPHSTSCGGCHGADTYQPALDQLNRKVVFPKLVVANDFFTDRSLEDVVSIEVVDLKGEAEKKRMKKLFTPKLTLVVNGKTTEITDLPGYKRMDALVKEVGDGRGYHGLKNFSGASLREVLSKAGIGQETDSVILASAPDGYRALFSYGEVFLAPQGERILVADRLDGRLIDDNGRFLLTPPDDLAADRTVKAVERIEVVSMAARPRIYVIGVGCADTSLITLEAISYIGKADVFVAPEDISSRFGKYMGGKSVLFDPLDDLEPWFKKKKENAGLSDAEVKEKLEKQRALHLERIRDALKEGRNVALLDWGDPTVFGGWQHWLESQFQGRITVVPGISAFNAGNAMMVKNVGCNGAVVLSSPKGLIGNDGMIGAVAKRGDTLAIFMGLRDLKTLVPLLEKHYPATTPVHVVYKAGYSNSERLVKTTLAEVVAAAEREKEQHLGVIYIGACLAGSGPEALPHGQCQGAQ